MVRLESVGIHIPQIYLDLVDNSAQHAQTLRGTAKASGLASRAVMFIYLYGFDGK